MLTSKCSFIHDESRSKDHKWYILQLEGLPPIRTKLSHGKKEIGRALESQMAKQLHVSTAFFRELVRCTKSYDQYQTELKENPQPPFPQLPKSEISEED